MISAGSSAADPGFFATTTGTCNDSGYAIPAPPSTHSSTVLRVVSRGSAGQAHFYFGGDLSWGANDVLWVAFGSLGSNDNDIGYVRCPGSGDYEFDVADTPSVPTSYSGATTADAGSRNSSELRFHVNAAASYLANLSLAQGAITLGGGTTTKTFASSGQYDLGVLSPGDHSVTVDANDGPQAKWTIAIAAVPVAITGTSLSPGIIRSGEIATASYALTSTANVDATVKDASGTVVRTLASQLSVERGEHSFKWDGLNSAGKSVADGSYQFAVAATDASGATASGTADLIIDDHGPTVTFRSPGSVAPTQGVVVSVTDRLSGVRQASLLVNGRKVAALAPSQKSIIYRPAAGWSAGRSYTLAVRATDRAGNTSIASRPLRIKASKAKAGKHRLPAQATPPKLLGDGPHFSAIWQVKPKHIVYTGDGSGILGGFNGTGAGHPGSLHWSSWARTKALGSGAVWADDCNPDCADGTFHAYAVKLTAFRPISGHFTRLTLVYSYGGKRIVDRRGIERRGAYWMYTIVGNS